MPREPRTENIVVGADLNEHVWKDPGGIYRLFRGKGYGQKNREREKILESMESLD